MAGLTGDEAQSQTVGSTTGESVSAVCRAVEKSLSSVLLTDIENTTQKKNPKQFPSVSVTEIQSLFSVDYDSALLPMTHPRTGPQVPITYFSLDPRPWFSISHSGSDSASKPFTPTSRTIQPCKPAKLGGLHTEGIDPNLHPFSLTPSDSLQTRTSPVSMTDADYAAFQSYRRDRMKVRRGYVEEKTTPTLRDIQAQGYNEKLKKERLTPYTNNPITETRKVSFSETGSSKSNKDQGGTKKQTCH